MFKKATKSIISQIDSGRDLVPVHSILHHEHFRPLCLVLKQRKTLFHHSPRYRHTPWRLDSLLLPGEGDQSTESLLLRDLQDSTQFTVKQSVSDRVDGELSVYGDPTNTEVRGAASSSKGWSIKVEKKHIPIERLLALKTKRKIDMNHPLIRRPWKTQQPLYVVHETIEALEEAIYEESREAGGSFKTQFYAKFCVKGTRENKQSITIPKGCTLAFTVIPLDIIDGSWDLDCLREQSRTLLVSDGLSRGKLGELEVEVKENCQILFQLSLDMSTILLKAIKAVMRDRNLFQELTQKMEAILDETDSCKLETESPDLKDLLGTLRHSSRHLLLQMARAIAYTLDALDELTEDQLLLLLESLEAKIVPQQLQLVASILEHNIEQRRGNFKVDASLLSFSEEKDQELTIAIVEMSGVMVQKDGSFTCMEDAFSDTAALCVSLFILRLLSK